MDQQTIPRSLLDYGEYHSSSDDRLDQEFALQAENEQNFQLPQLLSVDIRYMITPRGDHPMNQVLLARGYEGRVFTSSGEIAWLVGYCQTSESLGLDEMTRFHELARLIEQEENLPQTHFWLIAKEKFNQAALSYARESKIYTSNVNQLNQLKQRVRGQGKGVSEPLVTSGSDSYEMSIPMSGGSEMVAVRALEQVAEGLEMAEKSKSQLRMALLEACIHLKENFAVQSDKIHFIFLPQPTRLDVHVRVDVHTIQSHGFARPLWYPDPQDPSG